MQLRTMLACMLVVNDSFSRAVRCNDGADMRYFNNR